MTPDNPKTPSLKDITANQAAMAARAERGETVELTLPTWTVALMTHFPVTTLARAGIAIVPATEPNQTTIVVSSKPDRVNQATFNWCYAEPKTRNRTLLAIYEAVYTLGQASVSENPRILLSVVKGPRGRTIANAAKFFPVLSGLAEYIVKSNGNNLVSEDQAGLQSVAEEIFNMLEENEYGPLDDLKVAGRIPGNIFAH